MLIPDLVIMKLLISVFIVSGKHIMLDPTAGRGEAAAAPGPHVQTVVRLKMSVPRQAHRYFTHTYIPIYLYTYIPGQPHRSQTDTQSTHTNIDSTNGLILLPSLAEHDGGPLVRIYTYIFSIYTHILWMPPAAGLRHPVYP